MANTKEKIAKSFKELVFRKAFAKITITDIAKECNMTRENFYYHFHDKYDIVSWIFEEEIEKELANSLLPFPEWFGLFIHKLNLDYAYYRKIFKVIDMTMLEKNIYKILEKRIRFFVVATMNLPAWSTVSTKEEFIVDFFTMSFQNWLIQYVLSNEQIDEEKLSINLQVLFEQFLSFVRNSKKNFAANPGNSLVGIDEK